MKRNRYNPLTPSSKGGQACPGDFLFPHISHGVYGEQAIDIKGFLV